MLQNLLPDLRKVEKHGSKISRKKFEASWGELGELRWIDVGLVRKVANKMGGGDSGYLKIKNQERTRPEGSFWNQGLHTDIWEPLLAN